MSALDGLIVTNGPEQIEEIRVHSDGVIESVVSRPIRVFERQEDGSLVELHGDEKAAALEAFWASVDIFKQENGA
ncbi:hypothetical protein ACFYXS_02725 [Streptomyces sp. NPDC002574]|uniref:hypothetical protein n=1 Tax=Streptomyces sp. NPDC002574 TaxID=3364652 RepID=UPI00367BECE0